MQVQQLQVGATQELKPIAASKHWTTSWVANGLQGLHQEKCMILSIDLSKHDTDKAQIWISFICHELSEAELAL